MYVQFPIEPYASQVEISKTVASRSDKGRMCVIESPTGTGKTLGLLVGALNWLIEKRKGAFVEVQDTKGDTVDWLLEFEKESGRDEIRHSVEKMQKRREKETSRSVLKRSMAAVKSIEASLDPVKRLKKLYRQPDVGYVVYSARTHSQLDQTIHELRRLRDCNTELEISKGLTACVLASRSFLCRNSEAKGSVSVDASCKLLTGSNKCPFASKMSIYKAVQRLVRETSTLKDIEDVCISEHACPYYTAKELSLMSDIVLVPHQLAPQMAKDEEDNLIIVDEAHNLPQTLRNMREAKITVRELLVAKLSLFVYYTRFERVLNGAHTTGLEQTLMLLDEIIQFVNGQGSDVSILLDGFMLQLGQGSKCITAIEVFLNEPFLVGKIAGVATSSLRKDLEPKVAELLSSIQPGVLDTEPLSSLYKFSHLVQSLNSYVREDDTLITVENTGSDKSGRVLSVLCMSMGDAMDNVRRMGNVVLAAGTLSPISQFKIDLNLGSVDLDFVSAGHIIQSSQLLARAIGKYTVDGTDIPLRFTFETRGNKEMTRALQGLIQDIRQAVGVGGMVMFFPSYAFIHSLQAHWAQGPDVIWETQKAALTRFHDEVKKGGTPILGAVVGGSLSEGIDFSDDLCRCVVVVGLPFENFRSVYSQAQRQYFNSNHRSISYSEYAQMNMFKKVNQCIGRCIRHIRDWSGCVLIDERFTAPNVRDYLPKWVLPSFNVSADAASLLGELGKLQKLNQSI